MTTEKLVNLIADFSFLAPCPDWVITNGKNLSLSQGPASTASSALHNAVNEFFKDENSKLLGVRVDSTRTTSGGVEMLTNVQLHQETLQSLCRILPHPFLQIMIRSKLENVVENEYKMRVDQRFQLAEILNSETFTQQLLPSYTSVNSTEEELRCFLTIDVGWEEPPPQPVPFRGSPFLESLLAQEASKELSLVAGNGAVLNCHRIIFEAHSDVLATLISSGNGMLESQTGRIDMRTISEEGLSKLILFLYGMTFTLNDLSCQIAVELFKTANKFKIAQLQDVIYDLVLEAREEWFRPSALLVEVYWEAKALNDFRYRRILAHMLGIVENMQRRTRNTEE